jgi:prepilin signal peptidase PulO-like enzyme (type II secretory pathway)
MPHAVVEVFLWLLGLCVGSFLNVVVYRLPRGLSIADPARSFCPTCQARLAWYDNVPLLSWLWLGGRCRRCRGHISVQYPLIEALTGMVFVLVYHLLLVVRCRAGLAHPGLPADLPLLLSWLVLVGGLIACSAMDIVSYTVDVRVTNVVLCLGIGLHGVWPRAAFLGPWAKTIGAAAALAAFIATVLMLFWTVRRPAAPDPGPEPQEQTAATGAAPIQPRGARLAAGLAVLVFVALTGWLVYAGVAPGGPMPTQRPSAWHPAAAALLATFAAVVLIGGQRRPADEEIKAAIEEERPLARRTAWREIKWLSPTLLAALVIIVALTMLPGAAATWRSAVAWRPVGDFAPLGGVAYAVHGAIVGAAAGWMLRIVFTLALGREAFGVGDIYILAAAGAAGGWDIALVGLLLSVGVALAGWFLGLLLKTSAMIPFGPWLALGFILALWLNQPAHELADYYRGDLQYAWEKRPDLLLLGGGLMLAGTAAALALARLLRRWLAPDSA